MDPNATLAEIRDLANRLGFNRDPLVVELTRAVEALDEWITGGGFLPTDWER